MPTDEVVTVKGTPVRSLQKFIEADLTPEQKEKLFQALPPEPAARFKSAILPTETIPVHLLNKVTEEAARVKGEPLEKFARRAGREGANDAVKGIYRFFALVLTPPALLSKAGQMWSSIYNRGQLKVSDQTSNSARIALVDFPSELAGCLRFTGWIDRMAELTGAKDIKVEQVKCFSKGDKHCEWTITWK